MTVAERVDHLDEALSAFITSVGIEFNKLYNSQMRTEAELRAFKEDTQAFKDEMREFKDEMREFKDEMQAFKDEMRAFKEEGRQQNREMNRRWGELANKLGTLVEDLVAPSLPRIVQEMLGQEVMDLSVRRKRKRADGRQQEYDALAVTLETVCLASVKSTLRSADIDHLLNEELPAFRTFFPEYQALPLVGLIASLAVDESVLRHAERQGLIVLAIGDQIMEVKNTPGFVPRRY
ncbi:MAG: hypothetical protein KDJ28_04625 [Candidatus Competibacteraceae bacterium]|nr:hypothetical protein [Candidatus Competibacteraceae bacterium]